jgi:hypothetical protein
MRKLWIVMTEMFGHRWTSSAGEDATLNQTWFSRCAELTDTQFRRALERLKTTTDEWPPSLPEFRRWALGGLSRDEAKAEASQRAEAEVARRIAQHNPHGSPLTYDQAEQLQMRLQREYFVELSGEGPAPVAGIEHQADSRRICQDEAYR